MRIEQSKMAQRAITAFRQALPAESFRLYLVAEYAGDLMEAWRRAADELSGTDRRIVIIASPGSYLDEHTKVGFCKLLAGAREAGLITSAMGFLHARRALGEDLAESGGGNYYQLEQRSPVGDLVRLELSGQRLSPVHELKVTVDCPEELELTWVTRWAGWEPLDKHRPLQKLVTLKIPGHFLGRLLHLRAQWKERQTGSVVVHECSLELPRLPACDWHRLAVDREVERQALRREFLGLVFGYTRWWEDAARRARLEQLLHAPALPAEERDSMQMLARLSTGKTILDSDIADHLHGDFDIFFSRPQWIPRLRSAQEDEFELRAPSLTPSERYSREMQLHRGFDHLIPPRRWERVEAMLAGLLRQGQARAALAYLNQPESRAFSDWQAHPVVTPTPGFGRLLRAVGCQHDLSRAAVALVPYCHKPAREKMWCTVAALALLSQPPIDVLAASFGLANLLWEALNLSEVPTREWYRHTFTSFPLFHGNSVTWSQNYDWEWLTSPQTDFQAGVATWLAGLERPGDDALSAAVQGAIRGIRAAGTGDDKLLEQTRARWF